MSSAEYEAFRNQIEESFREYLRKYEREEVPKVPVNYLRENRKAFYRALEEAVDNPNLNYPSTDQLYGEELGSRRGFSTSLGLLHEVDAVKVWRERRGGYTWDLVETELGEVEKAIDIILEEEEELFDDVF